MRTLILGYADADALTLPLRDEGGQVRFYTDAEFDAAKLLHKFPAGVQQLKAFRLEEYDNAIFLGESVAATLQSAAERTAALETAARERARAAIVNNQPLEDARAKVQATARTRNELMGKLHNAKARLAAHDATPETLRGKLHDKAVAEIQKLILGDPEKKIAGLEIEVANAIKDYDRAATEYAEIAKPMNAALAPAPRSQFVDA